MSDYDDLVISLESKILEVDKNPTEDIRPILADEMASVKITSNLCRDIEHYVLSVLNKDEEHVNFMGGNLTGVNKIAFTSDDRNTWMIDLLDTDELAIRKRVRNLPHIEATWVRATDGVNLSILYVCYLLHNSNLPEKQKTETIKWCLILLQFKFLSSLFYAYFKYPVQEKLALAVYDSLSNKYYIKKYRTWFRVLEARALDTYSKDSTHWDVFVNYATDKRIVYLISDMQTRLKAMVLNIYEITVKLNAKGIGIHGSKLLFDNEGTLEVKNIERDFDTYQTYIKETMQEHRAFIKPEIVSLISESITTMPEKLLYDLLNVLVDMSNKNDKQLIQMTDEILIYAFEYFRQNKRSVKDLSNLGQLIITFKSLFTASKTNNPAVFRIREYFDKLVAKNIASKNLATITGVRTGIFLYIIVRTLTKNFYN